MVRGEPDRVVLQLGERWSTKRNGEQQGREYPRGPGDGWPMSGARCIALKPAVAVVFALVSTNGVVLAGTTHADSSLLETFLDLDRAYVDSSLIGEARARSTLYVGRVAECVAQHVDSTRRTACAVSVLAHSLKVARLLDDPTSNTVTAALVSGRGSCAALIGVNLAVGEAIELPLEALVLRDHVLLASGDELWDVTTGKRVTASDLDRYAPHPPGGPVRVTATEYVAYYLDNLAARLAEAGRPADARRAFTAVLERAPKKGRFLYNYGTFLLGQTEPAQAEEYLSRAIREGWKEADAWVNRGVARWQQDETRRARRDFERALRHDPQHARARENLRRLRSSSPTP